MKWGEIDIGREWKNGITEVVEALWNAFPMQVIQKWIFSSSLKVINNYNNNISSSKSSSSPFSTQSDMFWRLQFSVSPENCLVDLGRDTRTSTQSRRLVRRKGASWSLNWPSGANFLAHLQLKCILYVPLWLLCTCLSLFLGEYKLD